MVLLALFVALQLMDALTTLRFLQLGVGEANPLIRAFLGIAGQPVLGLLLPKAFAVLLGVYAWRSGRWRLLRKMNVLFSAFVVWNLIAAMTA